MTPPIRAAPLVVFALLFAPSAALAEPAGRLDIDFLGEGDDEGDLALCVLLPYARCRGSVEVAIGYGGGGAWGVDLQWEEGRDYMQLYVDAGYLFWVVPSPVFHLGPTVGFEAELFDETRRYHVYATARGRLWALGWVTVDLALGPVGSFDEGFRPIGIGGIGELAVTLHGHIGAYAQTQVLAGPDGLETRVTGGFRGSLTTWAVVIAGMGG